MTCETRNLVMRSGSRLFSLDRIISSMSPCSFSMTTNTRSGVSNMHSKLTIPGCCKFFMVKNGKGVTISHCIGLYASPQSCQAVMVPPVKWLLHSSAGFLVWWGTSFCRSPLLLHLCLSFCASLLTERDLSI